MKIQFAGTGSAFTIPEPDENGKIDFNKCDWQSNAVVISESGKKLLIDCGGDARFSLAEIGIKANDIDAIYISHLHADHIGGMEWLAFSTYFNPTADRPKLYCSHTLMEPLWDALAGGLASIQGRIMHLTGYFDCISIPENECFDWEGIKFIPVQTVHVMSGYTIKYSYGLLIQEHSTETTTKEEGFDALGNGSINSYRSVEVPVEKPVIFFTTDTQFCPNSIKDFYDKADVIFHDCETGFKSGVHSHYDDLLTVKSENRKKKKLYHYQPGGNRQRDAEADGFGGFVEKGQIFEF